MVDNLFNTVAPQAAAPNVFDASQNIAANNAKNQYLQAQTSGAMTDQQQKLRGMQASMIGSLAQLPPDQFETAKQTIIPIANKLNPSMQFAPDIDQQTARTIAMGGVDVKDQPQYGMTQAMAGLFNRMGQQSQPDQSGQPAVNAPGVGGMSAGDQAMLAFAKPDSLKALMDTPQGKQASATAEDTGKNAGDTGKTLNIMTANLPVVLQRLDEMSDAAKNASYGIGVDNDGNGTKQQIHNQLNDDTAKANTILEQRAAQGVLPELGPTLAQAGIKGNKFLETLASSASGLNLGASPEAKKAAIDGLKEQYISNLKSTARQARAYGQQAPSDDDIDKMVTDYQAGGSPNATGAKQTSAQPNQSPAPNTAADQMQSLQNAKAAIAQGAPRDAVIAKLKAAGINPGGL